MTQMSQDAFFAKRQPHVITAANDDYAPWLIEGGRALSMPRSAPARSQTEPGDTKRLTAYFGGHAIDRA